MCTEQLPPGGYPIAVKYISYHKPIGCGASGAYAPGPDKEEKKRVP